MSTDRPIGAKPRGNMHPVFASAGKQTASQILFVPRANFDSVRRQFVERERWFIAAAGFEAKPGRFLLLPGVDGKLDGVLFGLESPGETDVDRFRPGQLPSLLPPGTYRFANAPHAERPGALGFALGTYQFARYRKAEPRKVRLVVPESLDGEDLSRIVEGVTLCRDITNTHSKDMGPRELEAESRAHAKRHGRQVPVRNCTPRQQQNT